MLHLILSPCTTSFCVCWANYTYGCERRLRHPESRRGARTSGASSLLSWALSWPLAIVAPLGPVPPKAERGFSFLVRSSVSVAIGMAELKCPQYPGRGERRGETGGGLSIGAKLFPRMGGKALGFLSTTAPACYLLIISVNCLSSSAPGLLSCRPKIPAGDVQQPNGSWLGPSGLSCPQPCRGGTGHEYHHLHVRF